MRVWGVSVSYFTGKLESYLRYKRIPYEKRHPFADRARIEQQVGALQVPLVERDDGRWMADSTPTILALEDEYRERPVLPSDPAVRFIALLIEDYADEWLWRAAMHYRWSYEHDRALLSRILIDEIAPHVKAPRFLKLHRMASRQHKGWVVNDGVDAETREHVEHGYRTALRNMTLMLSERRYLLGESPSIADIGLMGPMLRHFGQDPTPAEIMRNEAPAVYEWVARVWNAGATVDASEMVDEVPAAVAPMLDEIAQTHLVQLRENAIGFANGQSHFAMTIQGCRYRKIPVSRYRVYCLERLREHFGALGPDARARVNALLPHAECDLIRSHTVPAQSHYDTERKAPFNKGIHVYARSRSEGRVP